MRICLYRKKLLRLSCLLEIAPSKLVLLSLFTLNPYLSLYIVKGGIDDASMLKPPLAV